MKSFETAALIKKSVTSKPKVERTGDSVRMPIGCILFPVCQCCGVVGQSSGLFSQGNKQFEYFREVDQINNKRTTIWVKMAVQYLSSSQLKRLKEHKYSAHGTSVCEPWMQVFWRWLVEQIPKTWAPNTITLVGLLINISTTLILTFYSPDGKQEVRGNNS